MQRWSRAVVGAALALSMVVATGAPGMAAVPKPLPSQWWFTAWEIPNRVWPITQGRGVTVAVLDSGVEASIPDLAGVVLPGTDARGGGGDGRTDLDDAAVPGHGTGMASLIASQGTTTGFVGVAPQVKILPVVTKDGVGMAPGIRFAVDHGAKVINISQAGPAPCPDEVQQAVGYALEHDVVVVAGAGNDGDTLNMSENPANCAGVLAVGAVDSTTKPWVKTQRQPYVAVAAPGVATTQLAKDGEVHTVQGGGTSGSSALVSGAAALVRAKNPQMPARELVQRLIATARDAGPEGRDNLTGFGVVRPYRALTDNVPANAPNPVFAAYDKWKAENAGNTSAPKATPSGGSNGGRTATVVIGLVMVLFVVIGVVFLLRRGRRPRSAGGPPYGAPGAPPPLGGQYPPQGGQYRQHTQPHHPVGQQPHGPTPGQGSQQPPYPPAAGPARGGQWTRQDPGSGDPGQRGQPPTGRS
jgi:type VII secretion-associated serine protease mycosin